MLMSRHRGGAFPERLIRWLGVSTEAARLLVAVPAFRGAWLLGLFVVTIFAGLAALFAGDYGLALFLIVAPLAPVAGVAASFGGDADPCHELVTVTPYSAVRMLLLRTAGVLATSLPVTLLAGLALPGPAWMGVAWLTPAAAGRRPDPAPRAGLRRHGHGRDHGGLLVGGGGLRLPAERPGRRGRADHAARLRRAHAGRRRGHRRASTVLRTPGKAVMNTVTLTGLGKSYGRTTALCGVDLDLAPGITGLLGPNGAGKTTMLRILATALAADRGPCGSSGRTRRRPEGRVAVRRRLGYVPQETGFPRGFTAFAFVDYLAILKEWTDVTARHEEVRRVIDLVGLTDVATKRVSALSGGQRRRVVLAQALAREPGPAGPRRADRRSRPCPEGSAARRAGSGRGDVDGGHLHAPDRGRGRPVRAGGGHRRGPGPLRRHGDGHDRPGRRAGSGWRPSATRPPNMPGAPAAGGSATSVIRLRPPSSSSRPWRTPTC